MYKTYIPGGIGPLDEVRNLKMSYTIREIEAGFLIITPAGNVIYGDDRPRIFPTVAHAEAYIEYLVRFDAPHPGLTKSQRRDVRRELGAKIGLTYDQARGYFA